MSDFSDYFGDGTRYLPVDLKDFYFLCAGKADYDEEKHLESRRALSLSDEGWVRARMARCTAASQPINRVVASPLAMEMARLATDQLVWWIQREADLQEPAEGTDAPDWPATGNNSGCEAGEMFARSVARGLRHCSTAGTLIVSDPSILRLILILLKVDAKYIDNLSMTQLLFFKNSDLGWKIFCLSPQKEIVSIEARLLNVEGQSVVDVTVKTKDGVDRRNSALGGSSFGQCQAAVLTDENSLEYRDPGVEDAVWIINELIGPALIGKDAIDLENIDLTMIDLDGTSYKSKPGRTAIYLVSVAVYRAAAASLGIPIYRSFAPIKTIPVPWFTVIEGTRSGGRRGLVSEYIIIPHGAHDIKTAMQWGVAVFSELADVLTEFTGHAPIIGTSGSYEAPSDDPGTVLDYILMAIDSLGHTDNIAFALDFAGGGFYDKMTGTYADGDDQASSTEVIEYLEALTQTYDIPFLVEPFNANGWTAHSIAVRDLKRTTIIGDRLIATNVDRLKMAWQERVVGGFIFRSNQSGTITEAVEARDFATKNGMVTIASTCFDGVNEIDVELSIALRMPFLKIGAPGSKECIERGNLLKRVSADNRNCGLHDIRHLLGFLNPDTEQ